MVFPRSKASADQVGDSLGVADLPRSSGIVPVHAPAMVRNILDNPQASPYSHIAEAYPYLERHARFLRELPESSYLGEGTQGLIAVSASDPDAVWKYPLHAEGEEVLLREARQHFLLRRAWKEIGEGRPSRVRIPAILDAEMEPYPRLKMERIHGKCLKSFQLLVKYRESLERTFGRSYAPESPYFTALSDREFEWLLERHLGVTKVEADFEADDGREVLERLFPELSAPFEQALRMLADR